MDKAATTMHEAASDAASFSDFFYPVVFPYKINNWIARMWALPLIAYIPIADLILLRGWRLKLVRRMAREEEKHSFTLLTQPLCD